MTEKRVLLTANYSVIEPLFALHLGGLMRDMDIPWTFMPVKKYDYAPLLKRADEFGATHIGFNVYSGNHRQVYAAAEQFRKRGVKVLIGGPHATYFDKASAEHADMVFKGQSFDSLHAYFSESVEGFARETIHHQVYKMHFTKLAIDMRKRKKLPANAKLEGTDFQEVDKQSTWRALEALGKPDINMRISHMLTSKVLFRDYLSDTFPRPDRKTFYKDNPDMFENPIKNFIGGEGCPFACTYCYNVAWNSPEMYGRFLRRVLRPMDELIDELKELKNDGHTKLLYAQDDVFGFEPKWVEEFTTRYKEEVGIPLHVQLRLELAHGDIGRWRLSQLKDAGCTGITVAIENGTYEVRKHILDRPMKDRHVIDGCMNITKSGLTLRTEQILGVPGPDTKPGGSALAYDLSTLRINCLMKPEVAWTAILAPYGGTKLGDICVAQGLYPADKLKTNDDVKDSFFDESALEYLALYKDQVRVLQRFFSTFGHIDRGTEIAARFLTEVIPKQTHATLEDFLVPAKDVAKLTKVKLYDNVLYRTKDEKAHAAFAGLESCRPGTEQTYPDGNGGIDRKDSVKLLAQQSPRVITLDELARYSWDDEQQRVFRAMHPLWNRVPRGELVAEQFLLGFSQYSSTQRQAFVYIVEELGMIAREVMAKGPLDVAAEVASILKAERAKLGDAAESDDDVVSQGGLLSDQDAPQGHEIITVEFKKKEHH